jgi:hypothetical protein
MTGRLLASVVLVALVACNDNHTGIVSNPRAWQTYDTLLIWDYKAPRVERTTHRNLLLPAVSDSIWWTTLYDAEFWIYLYYGWPEQPNRWEFAYTPERDFAKLNAPEWYRFYGASNYAQATVPAPSFWNDVAVDFNVHDSPIILARRVGQPYPVFALKGYSLLVRPERLYPSDYYQEYGIVCRSYY